MRTYTAVPDGFETGARHFRPLTIRAARLQIVLLFLTGASSSIVLIEPSPYEICMALTMLVFFVTGLALRPPILVLVALLCLVNAGYSISAIEFLGEQALVTWLATSWFLAVTCVFFASAMLKDTEARLNALAQGILIAGLITALAGIAGYAHLIPGADDLLTLYGRAKGTFKDPNVFGAFLILPAMIALQRMVIGRPAVAVRAGALLAILGIAVLLSFSRAAWGLMAFCGALTLLLLFLTTSSPRQRTRIIILTVASVVVAVLLVIALLSIDAVEELFKQRASLKQSYDLGEHGRFGRHALGALMALDRPWGIGPLQFTTYFPEDVHNSYLNAFMSGGWLAGVTYPALILLTLVHGARHAFVPTPWRTTYLAVYAVFVGTALESFIIDTDHWRHYLMLIGLVWGLVVAGHEYTQSKYPPPDPRHAHRS